MKHILSSMGAILALAAPLALVPLPIPAVSALTAQAGSATATSRLTILTTPGEQGWLFSASSMPVTSSSVTLLGPDPAPAPKPATGEGSSVVVTQAGRDWTGSDDRADGAAEPRAQQA